MFSFCQSVGGSIKSSDNGVSLLVTSAELRERDFIMKSQFLVIVAFLVILSCFGALGAIGYDYCGKPCTDRGGIVCAYNQQCFTYFTNLCEMKKRNCDFDDRFLQTQFSSCLLGSKCRGI